MQNYIQTAEPLVPESIAFEVEGGAEKLQSHKSPGTDQIPAELIEAGRRTIRSELHKLFNSIWNNKELQQWKELIIVHIHKKGDETDCGNYRGLSLLPITYKILTNILLWKWTPYAEEIIGNQCQFQRNRSNTDHIFCIRQIREKKWEYNEAVHQLFKDFKKAHSSVRRDVLFDILNVFCIPIKPVRLMKICLDEIYSSIVGKQLSDIFPIKDHLKQGDALSP